MLSRSSYLLVPLTLAAAVTSASPAAAYWTAPVSEEHGGPPTYCADTDEGANGFSCAGGWCDTVALQCRTLPYGYRFPSYRWSDFFSEERPPWSTSYSEGWFGRDSGNLHACNATGASGIVTGIRCRGRRCDDISLECAEPTKYYQAGFTTIPVPRRLTDCSWSGWHSEEEGRVDFSDRFITAVECRGGWCDHKRFYVCALADPGW